MDAYAQKIAKVSAHYTYYTPENVTLEDAKHIAISRAQVQAIADEFGTIISQTNSTIVHNSHDASSVDFQSIGLSDVRGEWIETIGSPKFEIFYENEILIVSVQIVGKIRELVGTKANLLLKILRNGTDDRYESSEFRDGDDLYISFQSPINGYIAIYLIDNNDNAYCLLPYRKQEDGIYAINANKRYLFFSKKNASLDEQNFVDEYVMTVQKDEVNQIILIFSPNYFTKVNDSEHSNKSPRSCTFKELNSWLANVRKYDNSVQIINNVISLR